MNNKGNTMNQIINKRDFVYIKEINMPFFKHGMLLSGYFDGNIIMCWREKENQTLFKIDKLQDISGKVILNDKSAALIYLRLQTSQYYGACGFKFHLKGRICRELLIKEQYKYDLSFGPRDEYEKIMKSRQSVSKFDLNINLRKYPQLSLLNNKYLFKRIIFTDDFRYYFLTEEVDRLGRMMNQHLTPLDSIYK
jgi:hypothetical protein